MNIFKMQFLVMGMQLHTGNPPNEPIETGYRTDGLRSSVFLQAFGVDYIARALWEARRLAPRAKLQLINEFGL